LISITVASAGRDQDHDDDRNDDCRHDAKLRQARAPRRAGDFRLLQRLALAARLLATLLARKVFLDIIPGAAHGRNFYRFRSRLSKAVSRLCKSGPWPSV
jgi:hypothetical protein